MVSSKKSFGAIQGVIWGHPGCHLGPSGVSFGAVRGVMWDHLGDDLGSSGGSENSKTLDFGDF